MRFKLKIFISLVILFFSYQILEIKAHNTNNGGCKEYCSKSINKKSNKNKFKILKINKKYIREQNSCVNKSLCRG